MTLGWRVGEVEGTKFFEKAGGGPGGHSNIRIYPEKKKETVFMMNYTEVSESTITKRANQLDRLFFLSQGGNSR